MFSSSQITPPSSLVIGGISYNRVQYCTTFTTKQDTYTFGANPEHSISYTLTGDITPKSIGNILVISDNVISKDSETGEYSYSETSTLNIPVESLETYRFSRDNLTDESLFVKVAEYTPNE